MTDPAADRIDRIKTAILDYLARHPGARDSARGICDCWLPQASQEDVERALQTLVQEGRVDAITVLHNPTLYARAAGAPTARARPGKPPQ